MRIRTKSICKLHYQTADQHSDSLTSYCDDKIRFRSIPYQNQSISYPLRQKTSYVHFGSCNRPLDAKEQLQVSLSSQLRAHQARRSCSRNTCRGCCMRANGLGRRLTTRGSYRPGRSGLRSRARSLNIAWYPNSHAMIRVLCLSYNGPSGTGLAIVKQ